MKLENCSLKCTGGNFNQADYLLLDKIARVNKARYQRTNYGLYVNDLKSLIDECII